MVKARIESIGAYIPRTALSTESLMNSMTHPQPIDIAAITGITSRRVLDENESSFSAAVSATRDCLNNSKYHPEDIDIVISCSISRCKDTSKRNYFDPGLSFFIKQSLGFENAIHFDVSNACAGMMTGVFILNEMIKAGTVNAGIVVSGEKISSIAETAAIEIAGPRDAQFASLTVGDSGAAILMDAKGSEKDQIDYMEMVTYSEFAHLCIGMPSEKTPAYALYTNNSEMHSQERLQLWVDLYQKHLTKHDIQFSDEGFDFIIHHQVGLNLVEKANRLGKTWFKTEMPTPINCAKEFGNTSSTSHFLALYLHLQKNTLHPNTKILLIPAASGIVTGYMSLTLTHLEVNLCEQ